MDKLNKIEILAPCGGFESLISAARCGADAVYLGHKSFSARAGAENFTTSELYEAVRYCHIRGVKVYLTLNTLIFDSELESALTLVTDACNAGVDAVIVQDIGLATLIKKHIPDIPLHGSTQMSVHTPSGAKALYGMGFKRVVLSRELTLKEIKEIRESCDIELEVFVHGALCMSVSGQCYFSAMLGGRSGNRGMCAQPCRLPMRLSGNDYSLSLKDNSLIQYIGELEKLGVTSAKIEGRMKRPEYVAAAVSACRESRDNGLVSPDTARRLGEVFSRTGFTDGYLTGKRDQNMFGHRRKEDVTSADSSLLSEIRGLYKDEPQTVPLDIKFKARLGEVAVLTLSDSKNSVTITGSRALEPASTSPLTADKASSQLTKFGGTPYRAENIDLDIEDGLFIGARDLNELRRRACDELSIKRSRVTRAKVTPPDISYIFNSSHTRSTDRLLTYARFSDTDIPKEFDSCELVTVPLFSPEEELKSLMDRGFRLALEIPRGMFAKEKAVKNALNRAKALGISDVLASNIGAVYLASELGMRIHGGFGLNITNTPSLKWAEDCSMVDTELSFELSFDQIESLGGDIPRGIISYGRLPLMLTRCCPGYNAKGGCSDCTKRRFLQDRMDKKFIFTCDGICTEILNSVPLLIPDKINTFCNLDFHSLRFTVENSVEKVENKAVFSSNHQKFTDFTRGLYFRGVK